MFANTINFEFVSSSISFVSIAATGAPPASSSLSILFWLFEVKSVRRKALSLTDAKISEVTFSSSNSSDDAISSFPVFIKHTFISILAFFIMLDELFIVAITKFGAPETIFEESPSKMIPSDILTPYSSSTFWKLSNFILFKLLSDNNSIFPPLLI